MKVLFIGDIYGEPGLDILISELPKIKEQYKPNLIIANAENAANGRGINLKIYKELMQLGISVLTMGNWTWGNNDLLEFIDESNVVRPANYLQAPGSGYKVVNYNGIKVLIINLLGRTFMNASLENPFLIADKIISEVEADYIFIDFHAEATSEKVAFGHYVDGRVDAVIGTHTHIPTADYRMLEKGTLYMTDVGMTGALNGVIGVDKEIVIDRFIHGYGRPNKVELGKKQLNAVILDFKNKTIDRIYIEK